MKTSKLFFWAVFFTFFLATGCKNNNTDNQQNVAAEHTDSTLPRGIEALSKKIAANPNDPNAYLLRGKAYYELQGYDEAIADLKKAISLDSSKAEYFHYLSDVYLDYYKSREALNTLYRAEKLFPKNIPTLLKLAETQLILKNPEASLQTLGKIAKIDPTNADMFYLTGLDLLEQGKTDLAISAFQSATENNSDFIEAWIQLGELWMKKNDPVALKYFDNALRVDSNSILALHNKATYYTKNNELHKAIDIYKKIAVKNPQYEDAFFNAGLLYMDLDSMNQAFTNLNIAVNLNPTNPKAYYYRGLTSQFKGDIANAKKDFENALKLQPDMEKAKEALQKIIK